MPIAFPIEGGAGISSPADILRCNRPRETMRRKKPVAKPGENDQWIVNGRGRGKGKMGKMGKRVSINRKHRWKKGRTAGLVNNTDQESYYHEGNMHSMVFCC